MPRSSALRDHRDIVVDKWKGLYARGMADAVPLGYFRDSLNVKFHQHEVLTRDGMELNVVQSNIRRYFTYKRLGETPRFLILNTSGELYDSLYPGTPLISNAAFVDFSATNYFNRAYITFHNRVTGISGSYVYVYEGAGPGTLRYAAGSAPSGFTLGVADSVNSGNVEAGIHLFAVAFETSSGFITVPGPETFTAHTAAGGKKLDFSAIPVGPSGTVARRLLGTRSIVPADYDGNQFGYELFFIPDGRIGNNVDTTFADVSFFDADLISSADYLFDNRSLIPAGNGIGIYAGHMLVWGIPNYEHYVFVSKQYEPEIFNETDGYLLTDPSDSIQGVTNAIEFRSQLYITKPNRTYVTNTNGSPATTWDIVSVDKGVGTECFGISRILDAKGANTDRFFLADRSGLLVFESGVFRKPEMSWSIKDLWSRINKAQFNKVQVEHDPETYRVFVAAPLDAATECSHVFVAYYENAISPLGFIVPSEVKWSIWSYPWTIASISVELNDGVPSFRVAGFEGNIYDEIVGRKNDNNIRIDSMVNLYYTDIAPGWVHHFGGLRFRANGKGVAKVTLYGLDDVKSQLSNQIVLNETPGIFYDKLINFVNEKMSVKVESKSNVDDWFRIFELIISAKPLWLSRPG